MKISLFILLSLLCQNSFAEYKVTFFVNLTPAGSFQAISKKVKGDFVNKDGFITSDKVWVSIESFNTGIDLRDSHLWKHLNSTKCPKAIMTNIKAKDGTASGELEVNCVKQMVKAISYKVQGEDVIAKFSVKASDFKLPKAEYLGVGVTDVINVEVQLPAKTK